MVKEMGRSTRGIRNGEAAGSWLTLRNRLCASLTVLASMISLSGSAALAQTATPVNVLTGHNDNTRQGQNTNETLLTPANVNPTQFGKLFSYPVANGILMQPLYVAGLTIPGKGVHNVVFVGTTTTEIMYAFDADSNGGINATPLWQTSLLNVGGTHAFGYGISSTPVIDLANQTMYVVSAENPTGSRIFRLHALNITTGAEEAGSPILIQATVPGTGTGSINGSLTFNPNAEFQRAGLLLQNGVVYVAFGSNGDQGSWHGWIFSFQESPFQTIDVYCTSANGGGNGIWQSGAGLVGEVNNPAKPYGRMFLTTANGNFSILPPTVAGQPYSNPANMPGMAVADFDLTGGQMTLEDEFTPYNWNVLDMNDGDLGSGGPMLLPTQTLASGKILNPILQIGKSGKFYILDRDNNNDGSNNPATEYSPAGLGGNNATTDNVVQSLQTPIANGLNWGSGVWGTEAYWNNNIYFAGTSVKGTSNADGAGNPLQAYSFVNGVMSTSPTSQSSELFSFPGPTPSVSSKGNTNGIVWVLKNDGVVNNAVTESGTSQTLLAYDATNLGNTLYSSNINAARDNAGAQLTFLVPTVTNGKVYVGSQNPAGSTAMLSVYGILADATYSTPPVISPSPTAAQTFPLSVTITAAAGATIYYTKDGTTPTASSPVYNGAIPLTTSGTIKAIASVTGQIQSPVSTATYVSTTTPSVPVFSLAAGTYSGTQTLTITEAEPGAIIYYTTDGSTPTDVSQIYSQPIAISASETVQAVAIGPGQILSAVASAAYVITPNYNFNFPNGFSDAQGPIKFNGSTTLDDYRLQLTDGGQNEAGSAFYATPVNIQSFITTFQFQLSSTSSAVNPPPIGDGITFTIQNNNPSALGGIGGSLGYAGIPNSVAIKFDLYNNAGEGNDSTGLYINGAAPTVPAINLSGTPVNLHSGDYINAQLMYDGTTLTLTLQDQITLVSWTHQYTVNIPAIVGGNTAYVGFTGGTGGLTASQKLTAWNYVAGPPAPNYAAGFVAGNMTLNNGTIYNGTRLRLTDGGMNEARSAFFTAAVNVQQFSSNFQFQLTNPNADGFTFTIQRNGPGFVGAIGGGLGYGGMNNSVCVKFDLYSNNGEGPNSTGMYTDGIGPSTPAINLNGTGINLHSGDIFNVQLTYIGTTLTVTITDTATSASATQIYNVNIPAVGGGNTAYVGFTAGSGGATAIQEILNWTYTPLPVNGPAFNQGFLSPPLTNMTLNGGAAVNGTALELTDGGTNEIRSAFYSNPVNVAQFSTNFDFLLTNATADGFTFTIQGDGPTALGAGGGGLGYGGLANSAAVKFDLFSNSGEGTDSTGFYTNGAGPAIPSINLSSTGINFHSGDIFNVEMVYNGTTLSVTITDTGTNASVTESYTANIPALVGGQTAYVGFTAASGGFGAVQKILNWSYN